MKRTSGPWREYSFWSNDVVQKIPQAVVATRDETGSGFGRKPAKGAAFQEGLNWGEKVHRNREPLIGQLSL
jgi:hypothetical protein